MRDAQGLIVDRNTGRTQDRRIVLRVACRHLAAECRDFLERQQFLVGLAGHEIGPTTVDAVLGALDQAEDIRDVFEDVVWRHRGKKIAPKTVNQKRYVDSIRQNTITFGIGPAGTGKTFLAVALAAAALSRREVNRIILTRPAVEAGERLGFLPGTLYEKIDPYLRPLYDALHDMIDPESIPKLIAAGTIEVAPLAYMRGRTLNNSFIILDEAQNTTASQMKMFLTRFGENVKVVITGDPTQSDIKGENGLQWAVKLLKNCKSVAVIQYENKDVVRSALVRDILQHLEKNEKQSNDIPNSSEDTSGSLPEFITGTVKY